MNNDECDLFLKISHLRISLIEFRKIMRDNGKTKEQINKLIVETLNMNYNDIFIFLKKEIEKLITGEKNDD